MSTRADYKDIWIALANIEIDRINSSITDADYAYVTVVGIAKGKFDFRQKVAQELSRLNFKLLRLEETEKLDDRVKKFEVDRSVRELAEGLADDEKIKFSTFHTYS